MYVSSVVTREGVSLSLGPYVSDINSSKTVDEKDFWVSNDAYMDIW